MLNFPVLIARCPMPNAQCPMPNAQMPKCPLPVAHCPMPNAQCPPPRTTTHCRRARGLAIPALLWVGLGSLFLFGLAFCVVGTTATFMSIASSWQAEAQGGDTQPTMDCVASHMYSPRLQHTQQIWHRGNATASARLSALDAASGLAAVAWLPPLASDAAASGGAAAAAAAVERATGSREARQQAARVHASPPGPRRGPAAGGGAGGGGVARSSSGALIPAAPST